MKKLSEKELCTLSAEDIICGLENKQFSLLQSFGAIFLRQAMSFVGFACKAIIFIIFAAHEPVFLFSAKRKREDFDKAYQRKLFAGRVLRFFFPFREFGLVPELGSDDALIPYYSHKNLNEPPVAIGWSIKHYPKRKITTPVNLPWFETLAPVRHFLLAIDIEIVPLITPSTLKKLKKHSVVSPDTLTKLTKTLETYYGEKLRETALAHGIAPIAPHATRVNYIFNSLAAYQGEATTLRTLPGAIAFSAYALTKVDVNVMLLPFAVNFPKGCHKGLNFFRRQTIALGEITYLKKFVGKLRTLTYEILLGIADLLPEERRYPSKSP